MAAVSLAQRQFFLPCTEYLELFWKNGTEKQASAAILLIRRCNICKDCPSSKNVCNDAACSHIVTTVFFIRQRKIILDGQFFPRSAGLPLFPVLCYGRSYIAESDPAFPMRSRFSYSSTMETSPFFTYPLPQRIITFFFVWNTGIT